MIEDTENKSYQSIFSPTRWTVTLKSDNKYDTLGKETGKLVVIHGLWEDK